VSHHAGAADRRQTARVWCRSPPPSHPGPQCVAQTGGAAAATACLVAGSNMSKKKYMNTGVILYTCKEIYAKGCK